jgi:hypothetical protein
MADLTTVAQIYDNSGNEITAARVGANNYKLLGDGAAGIGPYTRFGTPQLTALKIVSAAVNETTTPTITFSNLQKIVNALQSHAEIYYVGVPASDFVTVLVASNTVSRGGRGADLYGGTADTGETTFENLETIVSLALGQAVTDVTITEVVLTGGTFA